MNLESRHDGDLLKEFAAGGKETFFAEIIRRHGGMVLGICRRATGDAQDAEDAAQAVFLTLARKAGSLRDRASVGGWLFHAARHVSLRAREAKILRQTRERQAAIMNAQMDSELDENRKKELREWLDRELDRLPEKYRLPVVLHHLEERSQEEVAGLLGLTANAVAVRLNRARAMLAGRMGRGGTAFSAGMLVMLLSEKTIAAVPETFVASTVKAAAHVAAGKTVGGGIVSAKTLTLMKGMMKTLLMQQLKQAAVIAAIVIGLGSGGAVVAHRMLAAETPKIQEPEIVPAKTQYDPEALFAASRASFQNLKSIEFEYKIRECLYYDLAKDLAKKPGWENVPVRGSKPGTIGEAKMLFRYQKPMYFFDRRDPMAEDPSRTVKTICAFDGTVFQHRHEFSDRPTLNVLAFYKDLSKVRDRPFVQLPMVYPYLWAFLFSHSIASTFFTFDELAKPEIWTELVKNIKVVGEGKIDGLNTVAIEFHRAYGDKQYVYTVSLAKDLGFYPLAQSCKAGGRVSQFKVSKHVVQSHGGGRIVIPLLIEEKGFNEDGSLKQTTEYIVDEKTLRIDQDIPVETFTLLRENARLWDGDKNAELKSEDAGAAMGKEPAGP